MNLFQISIICLIFFILNYLKTHSLISPASLFNISWGISTLLASINFSNLFPVSSQCCFIIFLGVISFNVSAILLSQKNKKTFIFDTSYQLNTNVILIIQIIILISFLLFFFRSLDLLQYSTLTEVRSISFRVDGKLFTNIYELIYVRYIVEPFFTSMIIVVAYNIFFSKKINLFMLLLGISSILFDSLSFGSRLTSLRFIIIFIIILSISKIKKINITKQKYIRYILMVALISIPIIAIFQISILRQTDSIISVFINYITSQYTFMDILIQKNQLSITNTNGLMFFGGLHDLFIILINKIFSIHIPMISDIYSFLTGNTIIVGRNKYYNALATSIFSFYIDGGLFGVCIESLLFGAISAFVYNIVNKKTTFINIGIYTIFAFIIIFSILRWEFMISWPWLSFLFVFIISFIKKKPSK